MTSEIISMWSLIALLAKISLLGSMKVTACKLIVSRIGAKLALVVVNFFQFFSLQNEDME